MILPINEFKRHFAHKNLCEIVLILIQDFGRYYNGHTLTNELVFADPKLES